MCKYACVYGSENAFKKRYTSEKVFNKCIKWAFKEIICNYLWDSHDNEPGVLKWGIKYVALACVCTRTNSRLLDQINHITDLETLLFSTWKEGRNRGLSHGSRSEKITNHGYQNFIFPNYENNLVTYSFILLLHKGKWQRRSVWRKQNQDKGKKGWIMKVIVDESSWLFSSWIVGAEIFQ